MKVVLIHIIHPSQAEFIKNKLFLDNIILANNCFKNSEEFYWEIFFVLCWILEKPLTSSTEIHY